MILKSSNQPIYRNIELSGDIHGELLNSTKTVEYHGTHPQMDFFVENS